jgi:hypothetical protein
MRIAEGTVVGNTVVLEQPLPEGSHVTVYLDEEGDEVEIDEETEAGLREAIAQADAGDVRPMSETLAKLKAKNKRRR